MNLPEGHFLQRKKYRLTRTIGQGGFGITYLGVWNTEVKGELGAMKTKVQVCIKEYFFKDYCYREKDSCSVKVHSITGEKLFSKFKEKLIEEANILSAVHHPHIVNVLEVFEENNTAYIVMEYIKGCTLKYMLDNEGVLSENKVIKYTHQIGNALDFVHKKNVVHLDIKPGNILVDREDNARLIDFGVSKRYDIEEQETSTTTLTLSKGFASIEQYDNEGMQNFSACPDIYSLGATMYNLLTDVIPVESILRATKKMLPPSAYNSNITPKTEKAILKAMEVNPENRYQTVKEMLASIDVPTYELSENNLTGEKQSAEEDITETIEEISSQSAEEDDDRTILKTSSDSGSTSSGSKAKKRSKRKRKIRRRLLTVAAILLFAFIGYATYSYFYDVSTFQSLFGAINLPWIEIKTDNMANTKPSNDNEPSQQNPSDTDPDIKLDTESEPDTESETNTEIHEQAVPAVQTQNSPTRPETTPNNATVSNSEPRTTIPQPNTGNTNEEKISELEKQFDDLFAAGKKKYDAEDYSGAIPVFEEAKKNADELSTMGNRKNTSELDNYLRNSREKEKEALLAKYTPIQTFNWGDLQIVRKNDTEKIGAINASGIEVIPCIYNDQTRDLGDNRKFIKDDNSADVYDKTGRKVN